MLSGRIGITGGCAEWIEAAIVATVQAGLWQPPSWILLGVLHNTHSLPPHASAPFSQDAPCFSLPTFASRESRFFLRLFVHTRFVLRRLYSSQVPSHSPGRVRQPALLVCHSDPDNSLHALALHAATTVDPIALRISL